MSSKTRNMLEDLVRDTSFKWLLGKQSLFDEEIEEMGRSPSAGTNWIPELSPIANVVVRRCSKILGVSANDLRDSFNQEAFESLKQPSLFARNFLEYSVAIKKMRTQSESSLLSGVRSKREKILEIDGTVTTQPVLEHVGISTCLACFVKTRDTNSTSPFLNGTDSVIGSAFLDPC